MQNSSSNLLKQKIKKLEAELSKAKNCNESLRQEKYKHDFIMNNIEDVIWLFDIDGLSLKYVTPSVEQVLGYTQEEIYDPLKQDFWTPSSLKVIFGITEEELAIEQNESDNVLNSRTIELEVTKKNGKMIWLEATMKFIRDDQRNLIEILGITRDCTKRKRLECQMKENERLLLNAQRVATLGFWNIDFKTQNIILSDELYRIIKYPINTTFDRKQMENLIHPEDRNTVQQAVNQAIKQKKRYKIDHRIVCQDGEIRFVRAEGEVLLDKTGHPVGLTGTAFDITKYKQLEKALKNSQKELEKRVNERTENLVLANKKLQLEIEDRKAIEYNLGQSENKFKTIFENASDGIIHLNAKGYIIDINKKAENILGYQSSEVLNKQYSDFKIVAPEDEKQIRQLFIDIYNGQSIPTFELNAFRKDHSSIIIECSVQAMITDTINGFILIIRDVTEKKMAEEKLKESEEKFRTIFENANDEIAYIDIDGTVIDVNKKVEDIFGYTREEVVGKNFAEFACLQPSDLTQVTGIIEDMMAGKKTPMFEYEVFKKDGGSVYVEGNAKLIKKGDEIQGILIIIRNITERKLTENEILKREKQLQIKSMKLEEANITLKTLLEQREKDKIDLEEKVIYNVKELIFPYIEKLKNGSLKEKQKIFLDIIQSNLNQIIAPFVRELSSKYLNLTPSEIQIANLIKHGKTSKEISGLLNLSSRTVEFHRDNIRRKIGIKGKKMNLRTFLLSIQ